MFDFDYFFVGGLWDESFVIVVILDYFVLVDFDGGFIWLFGS